MKRLIFFSGGVFLEHGVSLGPFFGFGALPENGPNGYSSQIDLSKTDGDTGLDGTNRLYRNSGELSEDNYRQDLT